jgi:hypothetical protein
MLLSTVASFGDAGHGNADNKATTDNAAGQAWRFITQKPPRSGFVQGTLFSGRRRVLRAGERVLWARRVAVRPGSSWTLTGSLVDSIARADDTNRVHAHGEDADVLPKL